MHFWSRSRGGKIGWPRVLLMLVTFEFKVSQWLIVQLKFDEINEYFAKQDFLGFLTTLFATLNIALKWLAWRYNLSMAFCITSQFGYVNILKHDIGCPAGIAVQQEHHIRFIDYYFLWLVIKSLSERHVNRTLTLFVTYRHAFYFQQIVNFINFTF